MFEDMNIFRMAGSFAAHAATRQATIAQNVANADTPGYRARDLTDFADSYDTTGPDLRHTRMGHILPGDTPAASPVAQEVYRPGAASPNGNTVSLEGEMMRAAQAKGDHDKALAIYGSALKILRTAAGSTG